MKALIVGLLLAAGGPAAFAAPVPELICDPDARVTFDTSWIGTASVTLTSDVHWKLPRTGHEPLTSGSQLRGLTRSGPEELQSIPENTSFVTYQPRAESSPLSPTLYVDRDLLSGTEQDGLVVAEMRVAAIDVAASSQFHVYHCRRR
jgi:hypothetical protein